MNINILKTEAGKKVLMEHLLPDCLKPEYHGMSAYELSKLVLRAAERAEQDQMAQDWEKEIELEKQHLKARS